MFFCLTGHMVVVGVVLVVALGCMYIHKYGILLRYWRCGIASILTVAPICFLREVTWLVWPFWENDEQKKPFFPKKMLCYICCSCKYLNVSVLLVGVLQRFFWNFQSVGINFAAMKHA